MPTSLAVLVLCATSLVAADPLADLRFGDGVSRDLSQFAGQALVLVNFCSH